jgi:MFS family permease
VSTQTRLPTSYRSLLRVHGLPRLMVAALLGRTAEQMLSVAAVLFVLQRFHSAGLAGLTVFAYAFPGVLISPIAGALLDRSARIPLIRLDYAVAASAVALVVVLNATGVLNPALLLVIAVLASLTSPLSAAGTRSLFPLLVPRHLWDRANAVDSTGYLVAQVVGAPLAALIAGVVGRPEALVATGAAYAAAMLSLIGAGSLVAAGARSPVRAIARQSWEGLGYVARNPTLRGLAVSFSVTNLGAGLLVVALPVVVLDHLHLNAAVVGALWAISAVSGGAPAVLTGRRGSHDRERRLIVAGMIVGCAALIAIALLPNLVVMAVAMAAFGAGGGSMDIGNFAVRQRRTDPAWYGRAIAVSMNLNYSGGPVGSALAGPLLAAGTTLALGVGAVFPLAGAAITVAMVPARGARPALEAERAAVRP